jgi:hypothetical protein
MKITIPVFQGMKPIKSAHLLEIGEAQVAVNCDFDGGDLRALAYPLKVAEAAGTSIDTLGRWFENSNEHWIEFTTDVDILKGPVPDDSYERIYFTGLSEPRFFANDNVSSPFDPDADYIKLGVPAPAAALSASGYSTASTYRAYVYTFVNRYGEEGPPSDLLEISNYGSGNVTLTGFSAPASGRAIEFIRVYRTNSSGSAFSEFQLVFATDLEIYAAAATYMNGDLVVYNGSLFKCVQDNTTGVTPVGSATEWDDWYDGIADGSLQPDTLVSEDWEPPPDGLTGLVALPNGVMAGFVGSTIYQCEPSYPHAWPQGTYTDDFRVQLPHPIVVLKVRGSSLIALTAGPAYFVSGAQPDQMVPTKFDGIYPCVSKKGACESRMGVLYPSDVGLMLANEDGLVVATETLMDKDDWNAFIPSSMHGVFYDGKYICGYNDEGMLVIDFDKKTFTRIDINAHAMLLSEDDGKLYIVAADAIDPDNPPATVPLVIMEWAGADVETFYYNWESGDLLVPAAVNFGAAKVTIDEDYAAAADAAAAEDDSVEDYNAAIFAAGGVDGGLNGAGLNAYGLNGDPLRTKDSLSFGGTATFKWYADGVLKHSKVVSDSEPFRLPSGFRARRFKIGLDGYVPVLRVDVASGMEELYTG